MMSIASTTEQLEDNEKSNVDHLENIASVAQSELSLRRTRRKQKFSEKGKAFLKELRAKNKESAFKNLKRRLDYVRKLLEDPQTELEVLEAERDILDSLKDALNETYFDYQSLLDTPSEKELCYQWYDVRDRDFAEQRTKLCEQIQRLERESVFTKSNASSRYRLRAKSSKGSKASSNRSSLRSVSQARADAAAKAAKVKIEMEFLERENEIKRIQLEKEYALAKAEEGAFREILEEEFKTTVQTKREIKTENDEKDHKIPATSITVEQEMNPNSSPFVPRTLPNVPNRQPVIGTCNFEQSFSVNHALGQLVNLQAQQTQLSSMLVNQQRAFHLPIKEPPTFSGDSFEYPAFVTAFDNIIAANVSTDKDRLFFLEKYTTGKANEVIKGFLATNSDTAYIEARKLLDQRFGNPVVVAEDYKRKLRGWKQISDGDSKGLQEFSDFMVRCEEAMKTMRSMSELNSTQILQSISAKLPLYLGIKWCRSAHEAQIKENKLVGFRDLACFVKQEADLANDPIFSPDALKREKKGSGRIWTKDNNRGRRLNQQSGINPSQAFATTAAPIKPLNQQQTTYEQLCFVCDGRHRTMKCDTLGKVSADERFTILKERRLCFRCLKPGHVSSDCTSKSTCNECGKRHNTLLHGATAKPRSHNERAQVNSEPTQPIQTSPAVETAHSNATSVLHTSVTVPNATSVCRIVPVVLYHRDSPKVEVRTYALLDDASDTTFVTDKVKTKLGIVGIETCLHLSTMHGRKVIPVTRIDGLVVLRPDRRARVDLPKVYTRDVIPARRDQIPTPEIADGWIHLKGIRNKIPPLDDSLDVGILIGSNCPKAIKPKEVIRGRSDDPYAVRTLLGWCIIGPAKPPENPPDEDSLAMCNRIVAHEIPRLDDNGGLQFVVNESTKELLNPVAIAKMFEQDFVERKDAPNKSLSKDDRTFLTIAKEGIHRTEDGHYELPLPLRDEHVSLPNNRDVALRRLNYLKKRFRSDENYREDYVKFMTNIIDNGYAEIVPNSERTDRASGEEQPRRNTWFIPHHGLYHPKKQKFRAVFDCAATFKDHSLNKNLLQGPDLTNNLVGVLCRFRQESIAFSCDIEGMFHQVKVNKEQRDLLRFLWWPDGDTERQPQEYRMTVHLFGATSSPGCANFALKTTADDHEIEFGSLAANFLRNDFYVDDGLKSVPTVEEAISLIRSVKQMCNRGGFNLHKFVSNSKEVLKAIPEADRADGVKEIDMDLDSLPLERTLGVHWCIESDCFQFTIVLQDKPCTRRGILSTVSSVFDPLGFVAPLMLEGKAILQELCRAELGWDDPIPQTIKTKWEIWRTELTKLQCISIPRCYKPEDFGQVLSTELHHFSDASVKGYGQCSYLRMTDEDGRIYCSFVMGKSRVAPLKPVTIPRLELTAAVSSVRISQKIRQELEYTIDREVFWTDSKVVLGYINNSSRRFHVFVSNRVQEIQDNTSPTQWRHIESEWNPADEASRGMKARELPHSRWIFGPDFLWDDESKWLASDKQNHALTLSQEDPEVKKSVVMATTVTEVNLPTIDERVERFSSLYKAKRAVALCVKYIQRLKARINNKHNEDIEISVKDVESAGMAIIRSAQARAFKDEITAITQSKPVARRTKGESNGTISKLNPFLDASGVLRVGGRLLRADLSDGVKHPIILPKRSHVTALVILHFHELVSHQGKGITLSEIRSNGFWIIGGSSSVSNAIASCVKCRKLRGSVVEQKMSDLPEDRVEPSPPFTYCAVDYFGPFRIKEGRKELKRYGVLFTCMSSRAIHLETSVSLETDSFINALRRFLSRRGPVRQIRSDQGTNFVGARRELKEALEEMDGGQVKAELLKMRCDWVDFRMNVPVASHMGGVWERQIRTVRAVLSSLLSSNGRQLDDESLRTLMCEAESIVNSRPLTVTDLMDSDSPGPLTPNSILTMKTKVLLPPPGKFLPADVYARKRWRRVQHLANEFWSRWRKEFLLSLQERQKWTRPRRNLRIDDIVMVKDVNVPRSVWQLARVAAVYPSKDGQVRKVQAALADSCLDSKGKRIGPVRYLERPVQKLVLLLPARE